MLCRVNLDLVVLQEVKREVADRHLIGSIWKSRFKEWVLLPAIGSAGGILIIWDVRSMRVIDSLIGDFSVSIQIEDEKEKWWFIGVDGPSSYSGRGLFWDELAGLGSICGNKWYLGGDFNVVREVSEKLNSNSVTRSMKIFDELIREMGLVDPPLRNARFTWSNFREQPVCCRFDRFLFSVEWGILFPHTRQEVEVRAVSDNNPIILDSSPPKWGPSPFRFENMWLEHKEFDKAFETWWKECMVQGWEGYKFLSRLKIIKTLVKRWNFEIFGDLRLKEGDLNRRLAELDGLEGTSRWNEDFIVERKRIKRDLLELLMIKERSGRLKARVQWAKDGNANSRFFHGFLNARK